MSNRNAQTFWKFEADEDEEIIKIFFSEKSTEINENCVEIDDEVLHMQSKCYQVEGGFMYDDLRLLFSNQVINFHLEKQDMISPHRISFKSRLQMMEKNSGVFRNS